MFSTAYNYDMNYQIKNPIFDPLDTIKLPFKKKPVNLSLELELKGSDMRMMTIKLT